MSTIFPLYIYWFISLDELGMMLVVDGLEYLGDMRFFISQSFLKHISQPESRLIIVLASKLRIIHDVNSCE